MIVTKGPLRGAGEIIVRKFGGRMSQVNINIIGRSVGGEIQGDSLEVA